MYTYVCVYIYIYIYIYICLCICWLVGCLGFMAYQPLWVIYRQILVYMCMPVYLHIYTYRAIGLMSRVLANGLRGWGSILSRVIPKIIKMVLDTSLHNTQHYKVRIKGKLEQSRNRAAPFPTSPCSSY